MKHLLAEALELDTARQRQFLDSACAHDTGLRAEVDVLLAHQVDAGSDLMEQCAADAAVLRLDSDGNDFSTGNRIGPYRILHEIGRGGMGAVYLAERDDERYRQQVAIKVIKPGLGGDVIRRRFRNETQILAELNHANIARLLDAGETADGQPYLVMEYVQGSPINHYCQQRQLSIEQRLNLFCTVCTALQYAHQHLVIHRDIKPGNILVTDDGEPKLVDFGIAKLLEQGTDLTATAMPLMTPQYASPEQLRGESVTTATDVYSLGVVLYELLSGRLPYRFKSRVPHEIAKAICDDDPERPSVAMSGKNGEASQVAKRGKRLHADLDNIVLMAMRKEPQRRYSSAEQFAEDIRRHLQGLTVRARQDTFTYRAGKFIQRQKIAVAAAALVAITLLVGIVATTWQARIARAERARSERRFNEVRQLANSIVFEVHDAIANLPGSTPARSVLVQRGLKYLDSLAKDAAGDRGLQRELAAAYEKLGAVQYTPTVAHLGDLRGALESHHKAATLREALFAAEPTNRDYQRDLLDSYWFIATLLGAQGDTATELQMLQQQLTARRELAVTEQSGFLDRYNYAATYAYIGSLLMQMGDSRGALESQREALRLREEIAALDSDTARAQRALTISYEFLGLAMGQSGDTEGALEMQQRGLRMRESLVAADPLNTDLRLMLNESYRYVGDLLLKLGDRNAAREHYRKELTLTRELLATEPANAQFRRNEAVALVNIGNLEVDSGNNAKALSHYQEALRIREQLSAEAKEDLTIRRDLSEVWLKLGDVLSKTGSRSQALENYRKSVETLEALSVSIPTHAGIRELLAAAHSRVQR
ncbi:MAG TPA: serine/threonine-protein kinase [Pyrinomonadaceae bacterium]|nr:serine/threonine-protein kinase [Pyrinomonadaceae bacterium]